jgi:hypothetical protein
MWEQEGTVIENVLPRANILNGFFFGMGGCPMIADFG